MPSDKLFVFRLSLLAGMVRSLLDLTGLALLFPILQILLTPESIKQNAYLLSFYEYGQYADHWEFAFWLMMYAFVFFLFKTVVTFFLARFQSRTAYGIAEYIARERFHSYLSMPYVFYLQNNSGVLMRNFLIIPFEYGQRIIIPFIQLANELLLLILLLTVIIIYKPIMFLALAVIMTPVIYYYQKRLKHYLNDISVRKDATGKHLFKHSSQSMSLYREIMLHNKEDFFESKFRQGAIELAELNARITTINEFSPKMTELIAVGGIVLVFIISLVIINSNVEFIQFLILFTLLISRLLPSANRILLQSSTIRSNEYVFDYLKDLIPFIAKKDEQEVKTAPIIFEERITIKDLTFSYEEHEKPLFTRLNMTIRKGSSIGIIGPSGSGKTTLLHILLRLLREDSGGIYVDNVQLDHANKLSWYSLIGYVPQNINLIDGDFAENIAFGVAAADIDMERVKRVAELAQLNEFIEKQPDNYRTAIGEGGLKISGGQRQRVGIARALYHDAQLLIFDEATSALDVETEEMITESLRVLNTRRMTTIVVAHRLQTLRYCDEIYSIEQGKLSDKMKYSDL